MTKANVRQQVNPESLVQSLSGLRNFSVDRGLTSLFLPVYDPTRVKLHQNELNGLVHVFCK